MASNKENWQYVVEECTDQWPKGEIRYYDPYPVSDLCWAYKYEGASEDGKQIFFRVGNFGLISRLKARFHKKQPGSERIYNIGEFVKLISFRANPQSKDYSVKFGFTPLELIAKGEEKDRILIVKDSDVKKIYLSK